MDSPAVIARHQLYTVVENFDEATVTDPVLLLQIRLRIGALATQIEIADQLERIDNSLTAIQGAIETIGTT